MVQHTFICVVADPLGLAVAHQVAQPCIPDGTACEIEPIRANGSTCVWIGLIDARWTAAWCVMAAPVVTKLMCDSGWCTSAIVAECRFPWNEAESADAARIRYPEDSDIVPAGSLGQPKCIDFVDDLAPCAVFVVRLEHRRTRRECGADVDGIIGDRKHPDGRSEQRFLARVAHVSDEPVGSRRNRNECHFRARDNAHVERNR